MYARISSNQLENRMAVRGFCSYIKRRHIRFFSSDIFFVICMLSTDRTSPKLLFWRILNNPDHISESIETIFWVKILKVFDADPGFEKKFGSGSGMEKNSDPGSGINIPDPQHCLERDFTLLCHQHGRIEKNR
jgi:hypothetical protein